MSQALVQTGAEIVVSGGTSGNVTLNGVGAGNLLTASCINDSNGTVSFSASDNQGDSWSSAIKLGNSRDGLAQILYAPNVAGANTTVTITASGSITFHVLIREWSGSDKASPLAGTDSYNQVSSVGHGQQASLSGINPAAACICLVVGNSAFDNGTQTAGSGYTLSRLDSFAVDEYRIFTSPPSAEKGMWSTSNGTDTVAVIAAFKSSAAPAAPGAFIGGGFGSFIA